MQSGVHARTQAARVFRRNAPARYWHVCGRQQLPLDCTDFEGQSSKRGQLGQPIHSQITERAYACDSIKGRIGRVVHVCRQVKNEIYVLTVVDRDTHCVLSWDVVSDRTTDALQACLERAPQARQYYSDAFPVYNTLYYGVPYGMRTDKQETYSVEAVNADLRHYLKRLARRSRCFSRRIQALMKNIRLFVYCYNHRQLASRLFPKYSFHLIDFVCPLS